MAQQIEVRGSVEGTVKIVGDGAFIFDIALSEHPQPDWKMHFKENLKGGGAYTIYWVDVSEPAKLRVECASQHVSGAVRAIEETATVANLKARMAEEAKQRHAAAAALQARTQAETDARHVATVEEMLKAQREQRGQK